MNSDVDGATTVAGTADWMAAAMRLALVVSTMAAIAVISMGAVVDVTEPAVVLVVMLVGFTASWVQSGRLSRPAGAHRVTLVAVRRRVG